MEGNSEAGVSKRGGRVHTCMEGWEDSGSTKQSLLVKYVINPYNKSNEIGVKM